MNLAELRKLTPAQISRMSEAEARRAFTALRSGFSKQLGRLEAAGYQREIKSGSIPTLQQLPRDEVKQELAEMAYWSRQGEYRASVMAKRERGLSRWMTERTGKKYTSEQVKKMGEFFREARAAGILDNPASKKYLTALDEALESVNDKSNIELTIDAVTDGKFNPEEFAEFRQYGTIDGLTLAQAARHKTALRKYSAELEELTNESKGKKLTDKEVDNLIRRARRMHNKRG